jgi:hypothetical protein
MRAAERLVAVVEDGVDEQVLAAAHALGATLDVASVVLHPGADHPVADVLRALADDGVAGAALSAHGERPVLWEVVTRARVPLLVVPRDVPGTMRSVGRVLLPLDGSALTAAAVAPMTRALLAGGAEIVAVHVFDPSTAPAFWDQPAHSHRTWTEEFLRRHDLDGVRLDLRRGGPVAEVLATVDRSGADLVLLGWGQDLGGGHAAVVREALLAATVPVLLVGTGPGTPSGPDVGPSALAPRHG